MKIFVGFLLGLLLIAVLGFVVLIAPFLTIVLIFYIIFALPRADRLEHERKLYRMEHGNGVNNKGPLNGILGKLKKLGKF